MSFGYNSDQGWLAGERCDGSVSDDPQPSKPVTLEFHVSTIRLAEAVTAFDAHFLLAFFPVLLAKPGNGQPQWLIGMH